MEPNENRQDTAKTGLSWKRRSTIAGLAIVAVTIAGVGAFAVARDNFGPPGMEMADMGMGGHHGGMMQKVKGGFMEHRLTKALDSVDATDEQKQKIKAIFDKARESVADMRGERGQMRDQVKALLEKPVIDRDAVETMRKARVQKMDDASKIMTTAMIDAAEVLTPDQRAKLAKEFEAHRPRW
ncbi:Spy/CpxP family protein refolding chaperone [Rhizobium sp. C4]|uniref:Spy/CpxP family protein refolding chaperone n=1 Tax=Rhizobium sp. C4 TaxID=1349800 RepID=UPI001E2DFD4F|nr:Spy/CpxP family protein refolding chaperone [Rhizobium sp. C4]MCD2175263.1 Spy/CpxP family protein refolding chaperone [Rhizobium sp. C4]